MLIPRFSLRFLLAVTTVCGLFFFVVLQATRGQLWAMGLSIGVGSLLVTFLGHSAIFFVAWLFSVGGKRMFGRPLTRSPFAVDRPPPQILPPVEPE